MLRTNLLVIALHNIAVRVESEKRRGRLRQSTMNLMADHIVLTRRYINGGNPTADDLEYYRRIDDKGGGTRAPAEHPAPDAPSAAHTYLSFIIGFGHYV